MPIQKSEGYEYNYPDKNDVQYDIVLLEKPGEAGLSREEVISMMNLISKGRLDTEVYPIEIEASEVESCAMGFITQQAAEAMTFDYTEISKFISLLMNDMVNEGKYMSKDMSYMDGEDSYKVYMYNQFIIWFNR